MLTDKFFELTNKMERLDRECASLRRAHRFWKRIFLGLLSFMGILLALGADVVKSIDCERLTIRDQNGRPRLILEVVDAQGPRVVMLDETGKRQIELGNNDNG